MPKTSILFIGATGYIGSTVLSRLLAHPNRDTFAITTLVRSAEKAKKLEAFGVKSVVGSFDQDTALVEELAQNAHVVFLLVLPNPNDVNGANALLAGLRKRHTTTGDVPILIHTSGTGCLSSGDAVTHGLGVSEKIYYDDQPEELEKAISSAVIQRKVDELIIQAGREQYLKTFIVIPGLIWGIAKNPLVDAGIANAYSKGVHLLIQAALDRGQPGVIGKGQVVWPSVNIEEQGDFYVLLFDAILSNPEKVGHGPNGYYFGENGDYLWYDALKAIGKALVKRGLSQSEEPTPLTTEEIKKYFVFEELATLLLGSNSRARAPHARSLGWQPKLGTQDFLDSLDAEVEAAVALRKEFTRKGDDVYPSY